MPKNTNDDSHLVEKARKGNMAAFGQLVQMYQDRLYNAMHRMLGNSDDALEVSQEAFIRALQAIKRFRGQAGFYTWLFRIGMNLAINRKRRKPTLSFSSLTRDDRDQGRQAEALRALADNQPSPEAQSQLREEYERVLAKMGELDANARAIIVLRDIEEFNYAEIAEILELPRGTVKSRLCRARQALREALNRQEKTSDIEMRQDA